MLDGEYRKAESEKQLQKKFEDLLKKYNLSSGSNEELVMFSYAIRHLCRIKRILSMPKGNMVLVGLGGSGK